MNAVPLTPHVLSTLPQYPHMLGDLAAADADMVRAVDAARASLAVLDVGLGQLDRFVRTLQTVRLRPRRHRRRWTTRRWRRR